MINHYQIKPCYCPSRSLLNWVVRRVRRRRKQEEKHLDCKYTPAIWSICPGGSPFGACIGISVCFLCLQICKASRSLLELTRGSQWDSGPFDLLPLQAKRFLPPLPQEEWKAGEHWDLSIPMEGGSQKQRQEIRRILGRISVLSTMVYPSSNWLFKQMPQWSSSYDFNLTMTLSYLKTSMAAQPIQRKARLFHRVGSQPSLTWTLFTACAAGVHHFSFPIHARLLQVSTLCSNFFLGWNVPLMHTPLSRSSLECYPPGEILLAPLEPSSKLQYNLLCGLTLTYSWYILPTII